MTIIGLEIRSDGAINLLVFDPSRADSSVLTRLVDRDFRHNNPDPVLRPYRRGSKYLSKYREFETLRSVDLNHQPFRPFTRLTTCPKPQPRPVLKPARAAGDDAGHLTDFTVRKPRL